LGKAAVAPVKATAVEAAVAMAAAAARVWEREKEGVEVFLSRTGLACAARVRPSVRRYAWTASSDRGSRTPTSDFLHKKTTAEIEPDCIFSDSTDSFHDTRITVKVKKTVLYTR
jgi:hypothetical protein